MNPLQTERARKDQGTQDALSTRKRIRTGDTRHSHEKGFLDGLKNRDQEALRIMIRQYHNRLSSVANRICNNPADAEEVLQDVYMKALNKIDRFEERSTLSTWLYRITVNTALMRLRKQRVMQKNTVPMDEAAAALGESERRGFPGEEVKSPDDNCMRAELCEQICESVENLPELYKSVFLLRGVKGLSTKETGEILNVTPGAVKSRLHRSRHLIREQLIPYLEQ